MDDAQIKYMADRFLGWRLPEAFNPDCGISFKRTHSEQSQWGPQKYQPTGTNLFDAQQATEMVRYLADGAPKSSEVTELRELLAKVRFRLKAQTDVGIVSTDPENEDPQHEFQEILVDIDDALGLRD